MHHNAPPAYSPYGGGGGGGFGQPSYGHQPSFGQPAYSQPSYAQPSYVQPAIAQAPALTVLQPSRPGIGQLAKEALVYSSVSAGVSAAVNRLLPGGIYGTRSHSGEGSGGSRTEITYNNYYYNQSNPNGEAAPAAASNPGAAAAAVPAAAAAPAAPAPPPAEGEKKAEASPPSNADNANPQQQTPSQPNYPISNDEVKKLAESLFEVDKNNAYKYITVNLQGETKEDSTSDEAPSP